VFSYGGVSIAIKENSLNPRIYGRRARIRRRIKRVSHGKWVSHRKWIYERRLWSEKRSESEKLS